MLTVAILKNGQPLLARSAVNRLKTKGVYVCDDGTEIPHDPKEGAVALAKKLLDTIHEETLGGQTTPGFTIEFKSFQDLMKFLKANSGKGTLVLTPNMTIRGQGVSTKISKDGEAGAA